MYVLNDGVLFVDARRELPGFDRDLCHMGYKLTEGIDGSSGPGRVEQ